MISFTPAVQVVASIVVLNIAIANANAQTLLPTALPAPVGHAQPYAPAFSPHSSADDEEQKRLSNFDAEQHKLDEMLDKKLNICRC
ncbi:hypothetical protein V1281_003586 [Nitrobacteraceae bacterium AZCC 2161]|jgi:hypothetical protein